MVLEQEPVIIIERIIPEATMRLRSDGVLHVTYSKGTTLDPELQDRMLQIFIEMTGGKKAVMLFDAMDGVTVTPEARNRATGLEKLAPSLAYAVIADSWAYRLIANFYLKFNKPTLPYRVFSSHAAAIEWLKSFLPENQF